MSQYQVKLWTHKGQRIEWALVDVAEPRKPLKVVGHPSSLEPPQALVEEAERLNDTKAKQSP